MSPYEGGGYSPPFTAWIALDMPIFEDALAIVDATHDLVYGFKVHGSVEDAKHEKVQRLKSGGALNVWDDRKVSDTPDTVKIVAETSRNCGCDRMTVHAGAGIRAMMAAKVFGPDEIVAITDLTSLSPAEIGILSGKPVDASVLQKARDAKLAGLDYLVCSGQEVGMLNSRRQNDPLTGKPLELSKMRLVVPGTRTISDQAGSQRRITTAMEALTNGADELVLGSEIWGAADPRAALFKLYSLVEKEVGKS